MSAEHAIKVFGNTDNQVAGLNGAIKMNTVTYGGSRKQNKKVHRGGKKNKSNKRNKTYRKKSMRGGK
jgi:hypothetical protein